MLETVTERTDIVAPIPELFARWFASRGWTPRAHQLELLTKARAGRSVLLIAPTGAGKTLAGFLPSLVELSPPSPLWGGPGWGSFRECMRGCKSQPHRLLREATPTPEPSPQGGGEKQACGRALS